MRIVKVNNATELQDFGGYMRLSTAQKLWDDVQTNGWIVRTRTGRSRGCFPILYVKKIGGQVYAKWSWQCKASLGYFTAEDLARIERGDFE